MWGWWGLHRVCLSTGINFSMSFPTSVINVIGKNNNNTPWAQFSTSGNPLLPFFPRSRVIFSAPVSVSEPVNSEASTKDLWRSAVKKQKEQFFPDKKISTSALEYCFVYRASVVYIHYIQSNPLKPSPGKPSYRLNHHFSFIQLNTNVIKIHWINQ